MPIAINGTTGVSGVDGSASTPALQGSDSNTGINFASDTVNINTGGVTRATVESNGRLGIGTASPDHKLQIDDSTFTQLYLKGTGNVAGVRFGNASYTNGHIYYDNGANMNFHANGSERMRILSDGSITTNGNTSLPTGSTQGFGFSSDQFYLSYTGTGANYSQRFYNGNGLVGSILVNGSSTAYNTSSDYRLKENASAISDGITRLKELKPYKFNFKADKSKTLDGFFAHEAQAVVPESATGTKDESQDILYTEEDTIPSGKKVGDVKETVPIYQGIDQSKLVPLLTAALQEAVAKIETLETKVAALEAG